MSLGTSVDDKVFTVISPVIDFKTLGTTNIFTVYPTVSFFPLLFLVVCDSATAANGDASFNIGWTAPNYTDLFAGVGNMTNSTANFSSFTSNTVNAVIPASTTVVLNLTSADTGTAFTGRFVMCGIYL